MAEDTRKPRDPWDGYGELSEDEREAQLQEKFDGARERGDQAYAMALAAAVANYELVQELLPDATHAEPVAQTAGDLHDNAASWQGS